MDILTTSFLFKIFHFCITLCTPIYATLFNSFSNKQIFKASQKRKANYLKRVSKDSKLFSPRQRLSALEKFVPDVCVLGYSGHSDFF